MKLRFDERTEAFRGELRSWLEANRPDADVVAADPSRSSAHLPEWARRWQRRLFENGWLVPGWPPELGGRNATPIEQMVYFEELARLGVPRSYNPQGLSIITPSIVDFGTEEQKEAYALPTLRAEITWCLGMSEPGAGSDLASLSTRAELRGDDFVVNGQKVWTSGAHHADLCFCFVRTDPSAPKHGGISVLVIDMKSPGIRTRPLPELTDPEHADFNEVFFEDVVVPRRNLVGKLNDGWRVTLGSLAHERGMLWLNHVTGAERVLERLVALADVRGPRGARLGDDPRFREAIGALQVDVLAMRAMGYRGFANFARGKVAPEHSILKLFGSELQQEAWLTALEWLGARGLDVSPQLVVAPGSYWERSSWADQYLRSFSGTIAGGTSEIQRNILATRILGLPRD
ncbi:MAG: acyl-CoA dehydrogenase family protein [Candidatus Binatia bacterium]